MMVAFTTWGRRWTGYDALAAAAAAIVTSPQGFHAFTATRRWDGNLSEDAWLPSQIL
jgi:hypothetical protein